VTDAFVPRVPLTAAERHVDFAAHNTHIIEQRRTVEHGAQPLARKLAQLTVELMGLPSQAIIDRLEQRLRAGLDRTAAFGYREARREITALRAGQTARAEWSILDPAEHGRLARDGLDGIRDLIRRRARDTAVAVADAAARAAQNETDQVLRTAATVAAATRTLHNHVLELIGETLNMGRTAGALSFDEPPEFAMRSEQLDENTCPGCEEVHGTVVQVDTADFYAILPPADCFGGGRCRGVMVFADRVDDVRQAYVQPNPSLLRD
jgi:hypothetical protein